MKLEELFVYKKAMELADDIWKLVINWHFFDKDVIGKQLIRSADSIAANISEGFGRYHYKDAKNFYYYSRGSLFETKTWITKALERNLISKRTFDDLYQKIEFLTASLNNYIKSIGN
jgi:four helix bundle protein